MSRAGAVVARPASNCILLFKPCWGGLGDNLYWSHIPRIAKQLGYRRVCLDESTGYRDAATRKIVWESNPYLDEFYLPGKYPPAPHIPPMWHEKQLVEKLAAGRDLTGLNTMDWNMLALGLDDGVRGHAPELYYKPRKLEAMAGKHVLSLNCVTSFRLWGIPNPQRARQNMRQAITRFVRSQHIDVQIYHSASAHYYLEDIGIKLPCNNLYDLADVIFSCASFNCVLSGPYCMAIAYHKKCRVVLLDLFVNRGDVSVRSDTECYLVRC
jgi:hypothetical protein